MSKGVNTAAAEENSPLKKRAGMSPIVKQLLTTIAAFVVICIAFTILNPNFISISNILNVCNQVAPVAIISIGQTYVLITGGIDLSIGSNIAIGGVLCCQAIVAGMPVIVGILIGLLAGTVVGIINGVLVVYGKLPPFIATLGTMMAIRGLALTITNGIPVTGLSKSFSFIGTDSWLGIPISVYIMAVCAVVFGIILAKTKSGRYTYAVGSNYDATRLSGINVNAAIIRVYAISGFLSALAGIIMAAKISSAPPSAGDSYELNAVASSVIGGASTMGGEGFIAGTIVGAFVFMTLSNGLNLAGISSFLQKVVIGIVIIAAVLWDKLRSRK